MIAPRPAQRLLRLAIANSLFVMLAGVASAQDPPDKSWQACFAKGGFETPDRLGKQICKMKYDDAGKNCSDNSECEGGCRYGLYDRVPHPKPGETVVGQCATSPREMGCFSRVEKGKLSAMVRCVD